MVDLYWTTFLSVCILQMHELRQLWHVCLSIHVAIRQRIFVKMSSALAALLALLCFMVREGLLIPFTLRRCYLCAHLHHLHDSVVMIPVASRGQALPETSHFSLAESELGSVLMISETMSSGPVCHYFTWQSGSTKTQIMEENYSTYITMPPDESLIKHFLFSIFSEFNLYSQRNQTVWPLNMRRNFLWDESKWLVHMLQTAWALVLLWGMQVQIQLCYV